MLFTCRCCCRSGALNEHELCPDCATCLHCEQRPAVTELGLCACCDAEACVKDLYRRGHHWTPAWELHLRRVTARVQRQLRRRRRLLPPASV